MDPTQITKPDVYYDGRRGLTKNPVLTKKIATLGAYAMIKAGKRYSMDSKKALELVEIRRRKKREREALAAEANLVTTVAKIVQEVEEDEADY